LERKLTPPLEVDIDVLESGGKPVIRLQVPRGDDPPYAIDDNKIYVRDEAESSLAVRDEIVQLVIQGLGQSQNPPVPLVEEPAAEPVISEAGPPPTQGEGEQIEPPRTGVEIIGTEQRKGVQYHVMRDLRNSNVVKNVTRSSARRLWHYAITEKESHPVQPNKVEWRGNVGLIKKYSRGGTTRYDLVQRDNGTLRVYYGVTYEGMHGPWQVFAEDDNDE